MADENNAPDGAVTDAPDLQGGAVDTVAADTAAETHDEPVTPEDLASELGWAPKDKWRGDPDEWKPAATFLKETVAINKTQRKENKAIKDKLTRLERATDTIVARTREDERRKVEAEFNAAVEEGDQDRARRASKALDSLDRSGAGPDPAVQDFVERNKTWFNVDPFATQYAVNLTETLAKQGLSTDEQLERAEAEMRKRFPEHFAASQRTKGPAAVNEQQGRTARTGTSNRAKGFADLPADAKAIALKYEKQGVPKESFATEYWKENA